MDITSRVKEFRSREHTVRSWFVTTLMPHGIVMASSNRLSLLLLSKLILKKSRPFSTVTTEAEALEAIGIFQPGLLFTGGCGDSPPRHLRLGCLEHAWLRANSLTTKPIFKPLTHHVVGESVFV